MYNLLHFMIPLFYSTFTLTLVINLLICITQYCSLFDSIQILCSLTFVNITEDANNSVGEAGVKTTKRKN